MNSKKYNQSQRDIQSYIEQAHELRREFIVQHLRRGFAALSRLIRKTARPAVHQPQPGGDFCSQGRG